ncbi:MAG: glutamine-hydrolyzing carbamoyl-phosphate synthase small subunit [Lentisphaeria bacterium]
MLNKHGVITSMNNTWNWKEKREKKAFLALEDGTVFHGYSVGANVDNVGEVVFNTGMTGYQEILTDPSYSGQFVCMTYTEIGNYGVNIADMESRALFANGFIMHEYTEPSNWRCEKSLKQFLIDSGKPGIAGIDTRALTTKLREQGALKGYIAVEGKLSTEEAIKKAQEWVGLEGQDYAAAASCTEVFEWDITEEKTISWGITDSLPKTDLHVVAYDFGTKWNIFRGLRREGMKVTVVPAKTPAAEVLAMNPDGIFLSNGPADPAALTYAIDNIKQLIGKKPIFGICLGHQLLGLASGCKTYKMKFGHHGCNHPVKDISTGKVEITSQNHNFAIDIDSINKDEIEVTHLHLNDNTIAGIRLKNAPAFSVQYHPEACPGPHDPYYLFGRFRELILANK